MHHTDLSEQISYLNQRISAIASQISNLKSSKASARQHHVDIQNSVSPTARNAVKSEQTSLTPEAPVRGRGRPAGPAKLYSLRQAYQIFLERGIIVKRGRGRPRKAS